MVMIPDKDFRQLTRQLKRNADQMARLTNQVDQLLHINHQLLDIVVAGEEQDDELSGSMFLDGSD